VRDFTLRSEAGPAVTTIRMVDPVDAARASVLIFESGESPAMVVEGLTLTGGAGTVFERRTNGGAVFCARGSRPTLRDCIFRDNHAVRGGGVSVRDDAEARIVACVFDANRAELGAGLHVEGEAAASVDDCTFTRNDAGEYRGGGISVDWGAHVSIARCAFVRNRGFNGGAVFGDRGARITCRVSLFDSNYAFRGGAIHARRETGLDVHRCRFLGNGAEAQGGALWLSECAPSIANSVFAGNDVDGNGNGLFQGSALSGAGLADGRIVHCTLARNNGASTIHLGSGTLSVLGSVISQNFGAPFDVGGNELIVEDSLVATEAGDEPWPGRGNFVGDPEFLDLGEIDFDRRPRGGDGFNPGTPDFWLELPDLRLGEGSIANDRIETSYTSEDLLGRCRPAGPLADVGAYEAQSDDERPSPCSCEPARPATGEPDVAWDVPGGVGVLSGSDALGIDDAGDVFVSGTFFTADAGVATTWKIDTRGDVSWSVDAAGRVLPLNDGSVVVAGRDAARRFADGVESWSVDGEFLDAARHGEDVVLAGEVRRESTRVVRVDSTGTEHCNARWTGPDRGSSESERWTATDVEIDCAGSIRVAVEDGGDLADLTVLGYDSQGELGWERTIATPRRARPARVALTAQGSAYAAAAGHLVKYDRTGAEEWRRETGIGTYFALRVPEDGGIAVAGLGITSPRVLRFDADGTVIDDVTLELADDLLRYVAIDRFGNAYFLTRRRGQSAGIVYRVDREVVWSRDLPLEPKGIDVDLRGGVYVLGIDDTQTRLVKFQQPIDTRVRFLRGDCDGNGVVTGTVTDALFLLRFNFLGGAEPTCLAACDANDDGAVHGGVADAVYLLLHNFLGGPPPAAPYPDCGSVDREVDCEQSNCD